MALLPIIDLRDRVMFANQGLLARGAWPVARTSDSSDRPPFFILGSPRSGTTLLRAILCAHPNIIIPPENGALLEMIRAYGRTRRGPWDLAVNAVIECLSHGYEFAHWQLDVARLKQEGHAIPESDRSLAKLFDIIYRTYGRAASPHATQWGDKSTPGDFHVLGKLRHVFPAARYIHIVRDGRDCTASCIRAGFFDRSLIQAAYAWKDNVRFCRQFGDRHVAAGRFHSLRYEDLVARPKHEVTRLCEFLQLDLDDAMLTHHNQVATQAPDVGAIGHHSNVARPISAESLRRWQAEIPEEDRPHIERIIRSELEHYGYQV